MRLKGRAAVITGAGSGIGKAMALCFAEEGASVVVTDIVPRSVEEVVGAVKEKGGTATGVVADIAVDAEVGRAIAAAVDSYGRLDILCNNAGIVDGLTPAADTTDDIWRRVFDVNLNGPFFACRRAIPIMLEKEGGVIINTASVAAVAGGRGGAAYTSAKHALLGLTRSIGWFYGDKGIRCNAICPGAIDTPLTLNPDLHPAGLERLQPYITTLPPRYGKPEEVARAAVFLVSDDGQYVNGAALMVDGGWTSF